MHLLRLFAAPNERVEALQAAGVTVLACGSGPEVDLRLLMQQLGQKEIASVFVEGGGQVAFSLLQNGLVDKVHAFVAPKIVGGAAARTPVEGEGFQHLADAVELIGLTAEPVAGDLLLTAYVVFIFYETLMFRESGDQRTALIPFSYLKQFALEYTVRAEVIDNM